MNGKLCLTKNIGKFLPVISKNISAGRRRITSLRKILPILCSLAFLSAHPLPAQTTSTEILGTVTDATGAAIPGATVTIVRVATGEKRETTTTDSGDNSFPLIEIGQYK